MRMEIYNTDYERIFDACISILNENSFNIIEDNREEGYITASKKFSLLSFGEDIEIKFRAINDNRTEVSVQSYTKAIQVIDYGKNRKNENIVINALTNYL